MRAGLVTYVGHNSTMTWDSEESGKGPGTKVEIMAFRCAIGIECLLDDFFSDDLEFLRFEQPDVKLPVTGANRVAARLKDGSW